MARKKKNAKKRTSNRGRAAAPAPTLHTCPVDEKPCEVIELIAKHNRKAAQGRGWGT